MLHLCESDGSESISLFPFLIFCKLIVCLQWTPPPKKKNIEQRRLTACVSKCNDSVLSQFILISCVKCEGCLQERIHLFKRLPLNSEHCRHFCPFVVSSGCHNRLSGNNMKCFIFRFSSISLSECIVSRIYEAIQHLHDF